MQNINEYQDYEQPEYEISEDLCPECGNYMLRAPVSDLHGSMVYTWYCHFCGNTESE